MKLPPGTRIRSLSLHADYACARSGACCTSGWPIPVERETHERLKEAIGGSGFELPNPGAQGAPFVTPSAAPTDTPALTAVCGDGTCAFYERGSGLCAIHRQLGAGALPVACRQFPRVSLLDHRGLFVNLSHYCPTAARLLFHEGGPLRIVEAPAAFPPDFPYDPLDARDAFPPLLAPGVLLDLETYDRWEETAVATLAREGASPEGAIGSIAAFTEALRTWTPAAGRLCRYFDDVAERFERTNEGPAAVAFDPDEVLRHTALVLGAVPEAFRPVVPLRLVASAYGQWVGGRWNSVASPVCRYLAAKLFGSWVAYQGLGLRSIVYSLTVALSVLKVNAALECRAAGSPLDDMRLLAAIRRTDEILVHLASRERFAQTLSRVESVGGAPGCS